MLQVCVCMCVCVCVGVRMLQVCVCVCVHTAIIIINVKQFLQMYTLICVRLHSITAQEFQHTYVHKKLRDFVRKCTFYTMVAVNKGFIVFSYILFISMGISSYRGEFASLGENYFL